ncbi:MAG: hypothetical protein M4579_002580 [Chaenotheca gracillima]|nr:MAG: hypothetical protein M4579_002580 [Chaenotheca gracillima]
MSRPPDESWDTRHEVLPSSFTSTSSPLSSPDRGRQRTLSRSWSASSIPADIKEQPSPLDCPGFSRQNRRLQRRHANFRGSNLSPRPLVSGNARPPSMSRSSIFYSTSEETSPRHTSKSSPDGSPNSTLTPSSILELVTRSRSGSEKLRAHDIWLDETAQPDLREFHHGMLDSPTSDENMKLREGSINRRTPPRTAHQGLNHKQGQYKNSPHVREASSETSSYITYLEEQLGTLQGQLEPLNSPNSPSTRSHQVRSLTKEARMLRDEVAAWEEKLEERVQEGLAERVKIDTTLRAQVRSLEKELDAKNEKLLDLEWEIESLQRNAKDAEGLESENMNLSKRLDVLTELLALSPTKSGFNLELPSDEPGERSRRSERPRSMIPRIPCSPERQGAKKTPRALESNTEGQEITRYSSSSMITDDNDQEVHSSSRGVRLSTASLPPISDVVLEDTNAQLPTQTQSRPVSIVSDASGSTTSLGSPVTATSEAKTRRQRKMRHFRSGSCGPKALILPAASFSTPTPQLLPRNVGAEDQNLPTPRANRTPSIFGAQRFDPSTSPFGATPGANANSSTTPQLQNELSSRPAFSPSGHRRRDTSRVASISSMASGFSSISCRRSSQFESLFAELTRAEQHETDIPQTSTSTELSAVENSTDASRTTRARSLSASSGPCVRSDGIRSQPLGLSRLLWELIRLPLRIARRTYYVWRSPIWWLFAMVFGRRY